ncbi:ABC transporter ATP-binding protein, partial [Clostridium sporogenes]
SKVSYRKIDKKVIEITEKLGIKDLLNKYPYEISGGQKQRVAAARALINKPALILADEPTGALDSKSSKELLETLSLLNERDKSTIMMVTHDAFAASYCRRVIFIKDGKLYKEIESTSSRKDFFREIVDVTSMLGGENNGLI